MIGEWRGPSRLFLGPEAEFACESTLVAEPTGMGKFLQVRYTWSHEGAPHEGVLLGVVASSGNASAGWADSWHQSGSVLHLKGAFDGTEFSVTGSYNVGEGPDWGWRIALAPSGGRGLRMTMTNIEPGGEEYPAVIAEYERAGK